MKTPRRRYHESQSVKNLVFGVSIALLLAYDIVLTLVLIGVIRTLGTIV